MEILSDIILFLTFCSLLWFMQYTVLGKFLCLHYTTGTGFFIHALWNWIPESFDQADKKC